MPLIKHRPHFKLLLQREVLPGQSFEATVAVIARREVDLRWLDVELVGSETGTVGSGQYASQRSAVICRQTARLSDAATIPAGRSDFRCRFKLPAGVPPSYRGKHGKTQYLVSIRGSIPWWPDAKSDFEINVGFGDKAAPNRDSAPLLFSSAPAGPAAREAHVECSLADDIIASGGVLAGAIALGNVAFNHYTGITVALCGTEHIALTSGQHDTELARYQVHLAVDNPGEGAEHQFRMRLPNDLAPTYESRVWAVTWHAEIKVGVRWGRDVVLRVPVRVVPRRFRSTSTRNYRAPLSVGSVRAEVIWAAVARRHGLEFDADCLRGAIGEVSVLINREHKGRGGIFLVAELSFAALELDLDVRPASLRYRSSAGVQLGIPGWDDAHWVQGRDQGQVEHLGSFLAPLANFTEVTMNDSGARFQLRNAGLRQSALDVFVATTCAIARGVDEARKSLPPPRVMADHAPAWRELATGLDGQFAAAPMAISAALGGGISGTVRTEWTRDGEPLRTLVAVDTLHAIASTCVIDIDHDQDSTNSLADADVSDAARAFLTRAISGLEARQVEISTHAIALVLPAPIADPGPLGARLRILAELARALSDSSGPYR